MKSKFLKSAVFTAAVCLAAGLVYAPAEAAVGWQEIVPFNVPTNQVSQLFNYNCPPDAPVARSGSFENSNQTSPVYLTFSGTRLDLNSFNQWSWHFYWPAGAPAGEVIQFDVYCAKK